MGINPPMIQVMVTQTWAYYYSQLDKKKKIRIHILRPDSNKSYCGLENRENVGIMSEYDYLDLYPDEQCQKCLEGAKLE